MPLEPGTRIGPYEVTGALGAGGMGEVYRAVDRNLDREVAIKILPDEFARDPERLARFEREAKVLASLNHPNIAAIYGLESRDQARCLVLELVEGQGLDELIDAGPMPVDRAVGIAVQIAEALEAAHERGIIHRDLKPANVKVTPDGTVKVLDFGLAKAFADESDPGSATASMSPTLTVAATQAGVILGTAAYMSPEQAAGQAADRRSDVWAFGVVLLEMLTGRRSFTGETVSHVLASVLKDDPEWDRLPTDLPPRLRELLASCLRKKPRRRLQAIGDARVVLEEYQADPASFAAAPAVAAPQAAPEARRSGGLPWAVAALLVVGLGATLWALWPAPAAERAPVRLSIVGPEAETIFRGYGSSVVISPDGSRLAYVLEKGGERQLYLRNLDRWESTVLVGADVAPYHPFFSPDGQWIGFVTRTELKKVPVRGGPPLTLCDVELNRGSSWGADGNIVFAPSPGSGLFRVAAAGGEPQPLTELDEERKEASHRWPQMLPGGKAVLFTARTESADYDGASIELLILESGERRTLQRGGTYGRYIRSGHIVYANRGTLFALPFDLETLQATGSPAPILEGVATNASQGGAHFDVSEEGTLVYAAGTDNAGGATVVWVDSEGKASPLWDRPQDYANPKISPDGSRVALEVSQEGESSIWIYDLDRDVLMRLTVEEGSQEMPLWSPDGETIYYSLWNPDAYGIYRRPADGSGEPERIFPSDEGLALYGISPDETTLTVGKGTDVWAVDLEGGKATPLLDGDWVEGHARFSPDGRWLAYNSNESGRFEVYVRPAAGGRGKWQISTGGGAYPRWSGDGGTLYYRVPGGGVLRARVDTSGGEFRVGRVEPVFDAPYLWTGEGTDRWDVDPKAERFLMLQPPPGGDTGHQHIQVVLDWFDDLRRTFAETGSGR